MSEKVNKTCTSLQLSFPYKFVRVLFAMSPGAEKGGSVVVYDFITQYVIHFMG